jgi:hypothetical protein
MCFSVRFEASAHMAAAGVDAAFFPGPPLLELRLSGCREGAKRHLCSRAKTYLRFDPTQPSLLGRLGTAKEVGRAALFLVANGFKIDEVLYADSGLQLVCSARWRRPIPETSISAADAHAAEPDYDHFLREDLERVCSERGPTKRNAALDERFTAERVMYGPSGIVTGGVAISQVAGSLPEQFGPDRRFLRDCAAVGHHGLGVLRWRGGSAGGTVTVAGSAPAETEEHIGRLWVLLDPSARPHDAWA